MPPLHASRKRPRAPDQRPNHRARANGSTSSDIPPPPPPLKSLDDSGALDGQGGSMSMLAVGVRLHIWWPLESAWYQGTVSGVTQGLHAVEYDDGDRWSHNMRVTRWML
jgi:hypothetical protein